MPPHTDFAVKDPYTYLAGFGNYHSSEALPGAIPQVNNSPQIPPLNLRTERISGSSFTAGRERNMQTWLYRATSSLEHSEFVPLDVSTGYGPDSDSASVDASQHIDPNSAMWSSDVPVPKAAHWVDGQQLVGRNGEARSKEGVAVWLFSVSRDMPKRHVFSSLDGELLVVPQSGALDIATEMGRLVVRQNEMAVIPRGVRHRVTLPSGGGGGGDADDDDARPPCRGYICELFQGHFQLPDLGIVGSTGLANVRDFEVPTAFFDGQLVDGKAIANNNSSSSSSNNKNKNTNDPSQEGDDDGEGDDDEWTIISRLDTRRWHCTQRHTPFDVAGWHGTCYPYKYDLAKFCVLGNLLFDEHDPCLFTVLTAPGNNNSNSRAAVVDFAIIPPRYMVAEDTMWLPYYHRNTMQEFFAPIVHAQDPGHPFNKNNKNNKNRFSPFAAGLHGAMSTHGPAEAEFQSMRARGSAAAPQKVGGEHGVTVFLFETERPLALSDWARAHAIGKPPTARARRMRAAKM
ncbi:homogentisate 1,2-dioxygenase [Microdochium nivale]|nr:homogentisate 1,2-dioxygenase [Microdochium nivale]